MLARGSAIVSRYGFTAEKIDRSLGQLAEIVQRFSCSATLPVTASALAANRSVAMKLHQQGMEAAIHGLQHVDYSALSLETQTDHIRQAMEIFQRAGMPVSGFRCPYLRWNDDTLRALVSLGIHYDSSQALTWDAVLGEETEAYQHVKAFYRSQPARDFPSLPRIDHGLVRIPYCLPDDEALIERLHARGKTITEIWLAMFDCIHQAGELFTLGLHPERVALCAEALQAVLARARAANPGVWIARLDEVAAWYRTLGTTTFDLQAEGSGVFRIHIQAHTDATVLLRRLKSSARTQPWTRTEQRTDAREFTVGCDLRPLIAVAPDASPQLLRFLQHQGYLVEISTQPGKYSIYLSQTSFSQADERPLLAYLNQADVPLIRIGRWPNGAQSALVITGDVDAFSLLDYGRRIFYRP
jgi:hypothetical protein